MSYGLRENYESRKNHGANASAMPRSGKEHLSERELSRTVAIQKKVDPKTHGYLSETIVELEPTMREQVGGSNTQTCQWISER